MSDEYDDDLSFYDDKYRERLRQWAARALWLMPEQVTRVTAEVVGGCGNGTCEFTEVEVDVFTESGQHYHGREAFGAYLSEILDDELNDDGTPSPHAYYNRGDRQLFELHEVS